MLTEQYHDVSLACDCTFDVVHMYMIAGEVSIRIHIPRYVGWLH
jgi:hypothetical protein